MTSAVVTDSLIVVSSDIYNRMERLPHCIGPSIKHTLCEARNSCRLA